MERTIHMNAIRVFVNGVPLEIAAGATALDAVAMADADEARKVKAGQRLITDSRGLAIAPGSPVFGGAIFRTVRARPAPDDPV